MSSIRHSKDVKIFVKDIARLLFGKDPYSLSAEFEKRNELLRKESIIGAKIFGLETDSKRRVEFFFEGRDENGVDHWFFHQEVVVDASGNRISKTLHYEVSHVGILLVGSGYLRGEERDKFILATEMYHKRVMDQIYLKNISVANSPKPKSVMGKVINLFEKKNDDRSNGFMIA